MHKIRLYSGYLLTDFLSLISTGSGKCDKSQMCSP